MRPDLKTIMLLWKTKERNAHTLFGGICDEFAKAGIEVISAVTFLENHLAQEGVMGRVKINKSRKSDCEFGRKLAKDCSRLNIGQTVVVKRGTVLAVEGFEGTDKCVRRGGELGRGGVTVIKVAKEANLNSGFAKNFLNVIRAEVKRNHKKLQQIETKKHNSNQTTS